LAQDSGYARGQHIKHDQILELFLQYWGQEYLQAKNLLCHQNEENSWLKNIFRKHRKALVSLNIYLFGKLFFHERN
jgi:hypothetical protein